MLAVARDEHAMHLQSVTDDGSENGDGIGGGGDGGDHGHRRGPRRDKDGA